MHEQKQKKEYPIILEALATNEEPRMESYRALLAILSPEKHRAPQPQKKVVWFRRSLIIPSSVGVFALLALVFIISKSTHGTEALADTISGNESDVEASSILTDVVDFGDLELLDADTSEINEL